MLVMVMVMHTHGGCTVMFITNHGRRNRSGNIGHQKTEGGTIVKPSDLRGDNSETERPAGMMLIVMVSHRRHHHHRALLNESPPTSNHRKKLASA